MIFMYLHKAYDALQRYICLEILEGYGVGPRDYQILWTYWGQLWMVARAYHAILEIGRASCIA